MFGEDVRTEKMIFNIREEILGFEQSIIRLNMLRDVARVSVVNLSIVSIFFTFQFLLKVFFFGKKIVSMQRQNLFSSVD
jgi:hypothetical protein